MTKSGWHGGNCFCTGTCGAKRAGFTILELFVVVAVIGILMALALAAVQRAREAARLAGCRNNLRQIGQALHNFEAARGSLPAGCDFQDYRLHSWCTQILPYIDEAPLEGQYNWNAAWNDPASNLQVTSTDLPLFLCPSAITERSGESDYGGNYGSSQTGLPPGLLRGQGWEAGALIGINVGRPGERKTPARFGEFADGLSNTFLVLESSDRQLDSGSWGVGTNCLAIEFPINDRTTGRDGETILSRHAGGGLALFSDGHVNFLSNSTDLYVLGCLSTRAGHEIVVEP
jgi:prepilin-type N-terminal cleavage/methylation domain-containing protein